jgi:hypothetical protein
MKTHKPTHKQAAWLKRIAASPLTKTYLPGDRQVRYSLQNGDPVPLDIAERLIRNGWVKGRRDGFFGDAQSYAPESIVYEALRP